jgi:3-methyladenine DNA glycosylase AlkD
MKTGEEVERIISRLNEMVDEERREWAKSYYPTVLTVLGVKVPDQRKVVNEARKRMKESGREEKLDLVQALVDSEIFECQQVAYELISKDKKLNSSLNLGDLLSLRKGLDNWVSVDTYSGYLSGIAWREGRVSDDDIMEWARSPDRWIRRTALVSTLGLNQKARGGTGDTKRTLMVCDMLKGDHDEFIVKAMSWALRELSKTDHDSVRSYLEENGEILHKKVIREVRMKLETGRKNG